MSDRSNRATQAEAMYWQRIRRARVDLATFIELCARNEDGGPMELDFMHRSWIYHLNYCWSRGLRCMILSPFGGGKSSALAVPLAAWLVGKNPQIRLKFVSNSDDYAKLRVAAAKAIIESLEYQLVFPDIRRGRMWGGTEFQVKRQGFALDPTMQAKGVLSAGVGSRADVILFDDICDQKNTYEQAQRNRTKELVRSTWLSRLDQVEGRALWIATPWHPDDATNDMMHDPLWCTLIQRVVPPDLDHLEEEVLNATEADYLAHLRG